MWHVRVAKSDWLTVCCRFQCHEGFHSCASHLTGYLPAWCRADDTHLPTCRLFHQALLDEEIDHTYVEYEDMAHEGSGAMIALNRQQWFDYHVESMRRATANLPEVSTLRTTG